MIELKKYEIWLGYYHMGQGYDPPTKPEKIAEVMALSFKVGCYKFELERTLKSIKEQEQKGYVDSQSLHNWYDPNTMVNGWTGKYYESEEEALKSMKQ